MPRRSGGWSVVTARVMECHSKPCRGGGYFGSWRVLFCVGESDTYPSIGRDSNDGGEEVLSARSELPESGSFGPTSQVDRDEW